LSIGITRNPLRGVSPDHLTDILFFEFTDLLYLRTVSKPYEAKKIK
ncbi:hypothetical protein T12_13585, partial [Trichinella patagoniensis]